MTSVSTPTELAPALRLGYTTGTCAAAAAKAAALALFTGDCPSRVELPLPSGERVELDVEGVFLRSNEAVAWVRKDAGDDPDVTDGLSIYAKVTRADGPDVRILAGEGVGVVTKPGLAVAPGNPAVNPSPRRQIQMALREVTELGLSVTLSIPGGDGIARRTFNPRLGVMGGLSILGTDGRVRPFSAERRIAAILLGVDVAVAAGVTAPVLVPGHLGRRSALKHLRCPEVQVIEIGNEVGAALKHCVASGLKQLLLYGHPGKLAKLAFGEFDTHSSRSGSAVDAVSRVAERNAIRIEGEFSTTEALFQSLPTSERVTLASAVARAVHEGIGRAFPELTTAVWLTDLEGNPLATAGELTLWLP